MKNPLAHTPWWTTPLGVVAAAGAARALAHEFPATMLIIGIMGVLGITIGVVVLLFVMKR